MRSSTRACVVLVEDTNSSNKMDDVIRAELPHAHEDPVLHDLVKRHILHGACGALYPNTPCMKDGVCTKLYPRNLHNETQKAEMGIHCIKEGHERMAESVL